MAVRTIADAAYYVTSYSEFEVIIDIACALGSDHGQRFMPYWQASSLVVSSILVLSFLLLAFS